MEINILHQKNQIEKDSLNNLQNLLLNSPIPQSEILENLGLYMPRQSLTRLLFMHDIYLKILGTNGVIMEFGTRWGQNLSLFNNFRGIYEPYNFIRKVVGFDTFEGFNAVDSKDGSSSIVDVGNYSVTQNYEDHLYSVLNNQEKLSPISHINKFSIRKGDAAEQLKLYLNENPQTIIALAYFDMDLYKPTYECLNLIKPYLVKGSILAFDDLMDPNFPGETIALREVFDMSKYELQRFPYNSYPSFIQL
jgi:hypothetical protein